jgi:hypothetical protein
MGLNYAIKFGNAIKIGVDGSEQFDRLAAHQLVADVGAVIYGANPVKAEVLWTKKDLEYWARVTLETWMKKVLTKHCLGTAAGSEWFPATQSVLDFINEDPYKRWLKSRSSNDSEWLTGWKERQLQEEETVNV